MGTAWACSEHPGSDAPFFCPRCKVYACDQCATPVEAAGRQMQQCVKCNALLASAEAGQSVGHRTVSPIWERVPEIVSFLAKPSVWMVIGGLAVLWWGLRYMPFGGIIITGLEAAVFFHILQSTAFGADDLDPPEIESLWDDILSPLVRYLFAVLPIFIAIIWGAVEFFETLQALRAGGSPSTLFGGMTGPVVLLFAGVVLLPLLFAVAAIGRSVISMYNPMMWVKSIRTMGVDYAVGSVFFYVALAVEVFVVFPFALRVYDAVDIVFVGPVLAATIAYVPMVLEARILGAMCEPFMETGTGSHRAAEADLPAARTVERGKPLPPPPRDPEPVAFAPAPGPDAAALIADGKRAYQSGDYGGAVRLASRVLAEHADSPETYNALWLAAHAQERGGRLDLMEKSLRLLLERAGEGPFADRARNKLRQHRLIA